MERGYGDPGGNHRSPCVRSSLPNPGRRRCRGALIVLLSACVPTAWADRVPTASANAELVALAGALAYAESPQLGLHERQTGEASIRSNSLSYMTQKFAQMMAREAWRNMRARSDQEPRPRKRINSSYDLRLSDDKFVVRVKYRF